MVRFKPLKIQKSFYKTSTQPAIIFPPPCKYKSRDNKVMILAVYWQVVSLYNLLM